MSHDICVLQRKLEGDVIQLENRGYLSNNDRSVSSRYTRVNARKMNGRKKDECTLERSQAHYLVITNVGKKKIERTTT